MNRTTSLAAYLPILLVALSSNPVHGDSFGSGANSFEIEFVTIGAPGNPGDLTGNPSGVGSVGAVYRIGKYEISEEMIDKANAVGALGITHDTRGPNKPATSVSWFEAARFANWLNTSTGSSPAYKFSANGDFQLWTPADAGYNPNNLFRNRLARYALPSDGEWYKAAYFNPASASYYNFPTGSDSAPDGIDFLGDNVFEAVWSELGYIGADPQYGPRDVTDVGLLSPFGTAGQGGNVWEWAESALDGVNNSVSEPRSARAGGWANSEAVYLSAVHQAWSFPSDKIIDIGFRVTQVPEPSSFLLSSIAVIGLTRLRRMQ